MPGSTSQTTKRHRDKLILGKTRQDEKGCVNRCTIGMLYSGYSFFQEKTRIPMIDALVLFISIFLCLLYI